MNRLIEKLAAIPQQADIMPPAGIDRDFGIVPNPAQTPTPAPTPTPAANQQGSYVNWDDIRRYMELGESAETLSGLGLPIDIAERLSQPPGAPGTQPGAGPTPGVASHPTLPSPKGPGVRQPKPPQQKPTQQTPPQRPIRPQQPGRSRQQPGRQTYDYPYFIIMHPGVFPPYYYWPFLPHQPYPYYPYPSYVIGFMPPQHRFWRYFIESLRRPSSSKPEEG